jgi:signal transduction histidine kinase
MPAGMAWLYSSIVALFRAVWRRWRERSLFERDAALAVGLFALAVLEVTGSLPFDPVLMGPAWLPLVALVIAPLAFRRRAPLPAFCVQVAAWVATTAVSGHWGVTLGTTVALLVGAYSTGAYSTRRWRSAVVAVVTASILPIVMILILPSLSRFRDSLSIYSDTQGLIIIIAWLIGQSIRAQRRHVEGLVERARRLEREQAAVARAAVVEERARIARELHDVVAHGVAVMVVQAEAARRLLRRRPEQAEEALRTVSGTGTEALEELQHLLGVLGSDDTPALEPAPGLRDLDGLLERLQRSGVAVEIRLEGEARSLPRGLDLTAYRIIQEALTNVLKHAGAARAEVRLRYSDDSLGIEVTDSGKSAIRANGAGGRGLVGMRERVAAYGGELEAGPVAQGGFAIRARLPLIGAAG